MKTSATLFTILALAACVGAGNSRSPESQVAWRGVTLAFHGQDRMVFVKEAQSVGNHMERWIVFFTSPHEKIAIVEVPRASKAITNDQLNTFTWTFRLRPVPLNERERCLGRTLIDPTRLRSRPIRDSDFVRTSWGLEKRLPDLHRIPCFRALDAPLQSVR